VARPLKPTDGRLKANRDFTEFMQRAVYMPHMRGDFKGDPSVRPDPKPVRRTDSEGEMRRILTSPLEKLSDEDILWMLRQELMVVLGMKALSRPDNLIAHLRSRASARRNST
jgi:hypothetical protein